MRLSPSRWVVTIGAALAPPVAQDSGSQEAAKDGLKVGGHVQTAGGARRAIEAGIWSIEHAIGLNDELHKLMAAKGIFRAVAERVTQVLTNRMALLRSDLLLLAENSEAPRWLTHRLSEPGDSAMDPAADRFLRDL